MKRLAKAISQRIKGLREAAGLSQQELAVKADLSVSQVAKLEQGSKADPRVSTMLALARALGVLPGVIVDDLFPPRSTPEAEAEAEAEPVAEAEGAVNGEAAANGSSGGESSGKKKKNKKK